MYYKAAVTNSTKRRGTSVHTPFPELGCFFFFFVWLNPVVALRIRKVWKTFEPMSCICSFPCRESPKHPPVMLAAVPYIMHRNNESCCSWQPAFLLEGRGREQHFLFFFFPVDVKVCQEAQRKCSGLHNLAYGEDTQNSAWCIGHICERKKKQNPDYDLHHHYFILRIMLIAGWIWLRNETDIAHTLWPS